MAEDSGQERSEEPTGKRLTDARKKGQVARSRELNTFVVLVVGAIALLFLGANAASALTGVMSGQFQLSRAVIFDDQAITKQFAEVMLQGFLIMAPFLAVMFVSAFIGPLGLSGWVFSAQAFQPKWAKLDPIKGIARIFGVHGLIELVKSLLKFLLIFGVTVGLFVFCMDDFVGLAQEPPARAMAHGTWLIGLFFLILSCTIGVIASIDVPFQLWDHKRKLKMTMQEVKDEAKETDGRPEVKSRIRNLQMEMAQGRMMEEVPNADVIVTNPTHFAVALKYDQMKSAAPVIVAKGRDLVAAHIRNLGLGARVPIVTAPPLARALHRSAEVGDEIPEGLFLAVAQVLAYVYQLRSADSGAAAYPDLPTDFPIPEEYKDPPR